MPTETKAWKCNYCSRCYARKGTATVHENACKKNPERHHCATCVHGVLAQNVIITEPLTVESYMPGHEPEKHAYGGPICAYHMVPINEKPYFIECDTDEFFGQDEHPVPGTCWNYEYKGSFGWTPETEYAKAHPNYQPEKAPENGDVERMVF